MTRIVLIKFQPAGRHYHFNALDLELQAGSQVIVETDRGRSMATVVTTPREVADDQVPDGLKSLLRLATEEDIALAEKNAAREKDAYQYCLSRIHSRKMEMKLVRAEYVFDGSKIIFYFTADGRVDFRELVKDLAHYFHTRIEMRQIGVRDEAKLIGGLGICGRELCCCSFLTEFNPVSVKMAKEQGLALNPNKISGQCGRLLCCLSYEYETYRCLRKNLPKPGRKVLWQGAEWEVRHQDVLAQKLTLRKADGTTEVIGLEEFQGCCKQQHAAPPGEQAGKTAEDTPAAPDAGRKPERSAAAGPPAESAASGPEDDAESQAPQEGTSPAPENPRKKRKRRRRSRRPGPKKQGE
jgi:cell fate regulator YaaT (PSP1 superfamily)